MTINQPENPDGVALPKLRVGHMTYLNSEVFYRKLPTESCDLFAMPPRAMAAAVERGDLVAGPLPIAEVIRLGSSVRSLGNLGVAADGPALSVFLFSHTPVAELSGKRIAVTSHTATSIQLLRVLFADLWGATGHEFVQVSDNHDAALWIGDPALERLASGEYPYQYDLGTEWKNFTGLPFVFAEWVIRTDVSHSVADQFEKLLIAATHEGMSAVDEICRMRTSEIMTESDVTKYVQNFVYFFGENERAGQREFERRLARLPIWRPEVVEDRPIEEAISTSNSA